MPVIIPQALPASETLAKENIFVMHPERAMTQDIRPLDIAIVNLMPTKIVTETQLLRLVGNTPLQVNVDLVHMATHRSKNTPQSHLEAFYKSFEDIQDKKYDGMIITGAPVEQMDYQDVNYWDELTAVLDFAQKRAFSSLFICWGAQAALYHYYGIPKVQLAEKRFGVFEHRVLERRLIVRGFDDVFYAPHSRHTECRVEDILKVPELELLAVSDEAGAFLATSRDGRQVFVFGHAEYDPYILRDEYLRDKNKGLDIALPKHYFPNDDPQREPIVRWRGHGNLLFANWLNYHVYQETPYNLAQLNEQEG